jgi:hypothetical protein
MCCGLDGFSCGDHSHVFFIPAIGRGRLVSMEDLEDDSVAFEAVEGLDGNG